MNNSWTKGIATGQRSDIKIGSNAKRLIATKEKLELSGGSKNSQTQKILEDLLKKCEQVVSMDPNYNFPNTNINKIEDKVKEIANDDLATNSVKDIKKKRD